MTISIEKLKKLQEQGWIKAQFHPTLSLTIWNYTPKTQWESYWNQFTLMCRGLVTDGAGNVVAHPLGKFFNYSELAAWGKVPDISHGFRVYEKMDGSYIQIFNYKGKWCISSRGSFTSDHAIYAHEILHDLLTPEGGDPYYGLDPEYNYIFELIHPATRIVLDYGDRKDLVLLAVVKRDGTEKEILDYSGRFSVAEEVEFHPMSQPESFEDMKFEIPDSEEGYVIRFGNGERMKIKGDEYVRLHRIVTMTSSYDIWRTLKEGLPMDDLMERVPDEWMNWVYKTVGKLFMNYRKIEQQVKRDLEYGQTNEGIHIEEGYMSKPRKEVAQYFNTCMYPSIMFSILDGRDYNSHIWDMVKPEHEKAFSI